MLLFMYIALPILTLFTASTTAISCDASIYGPSVQADVNYLRNRLPFTGNELQDHAAEATALRIFAEPSALDPRFGAVKNPYPGTSMVQLPLVWRYRTARFALLNIADSNGHIDLPSSSMAWKNIHAAAEGLDRYCVVNQHGVGGSWVLIDDKGNSLAALYLYASGSPFEDYLNHYMITGIGINPYNPTAGLASAGSEDSSMTGIEESNDWQ